MSNSKDILSQDIEFLKGVGPAKGDLLRTELQIHTFGDLLTHYPFRYIDRTNVYKIAHITGQEDNVQIKGKLHDVKEIKGKVKRLEAHIQDGSGIIKLVWFRSVSWIKKSLVVGAEYLIFGKVNNYKGALSIPHPEMEKINTHAPLLKKALEPVYSTTEKLSSRGLDAKGIRKIVKQFFEKYPPSTISETLPDYLIEKLKFKSRYEVLKEIHFPQSSSSLAEAKNRLKFEEFFFIQLPLLLRRSSNLKNKGYAFEMVGDHFKNFFQNRLTFKLTSAQKRVLKEIRSDLGKGIQMNRLLQGDVGSGKTVVGLMTMLLALDNGFQACLMAPTEVLARQHLTSIKKHLGDMEVKVEFLSGSVKGAQRKRILSELKSGEIDILIGTHALLEKPVVYENLGLAITDEQHRFGVAQRAALWTKGKNFPPHVLVMTATPIPRTLAMTLYGDLQVSVIDELPPGRQEVITLHRKDSHRMLLYKFIKEEIAKGRQIFFVFPLIEESSTLDLQNLLDGYDQILEYFPRPQYQISMVHGKMSSEDKDKAMKDFAAGKANILMATTVIEVGVNVPNATVMIIENAERFGLSQLHQLRGRVGRGGNQSYCILLTANNLTKQAMERMKIMTSTNNGFEIADADLRMRGPGNIEGTRQSGVLELKIGNIVQDGAILQTARAIASRIVDRDPKLTNKHNERLHYFMQHYKGGIEWGQIS